MMSLILGIDQSYSSTGYVILNTDCNVIDFGTISAKKSDKYDIFDRATIISTGLIQLTKQYKPMICGIEGLAFSKLGNATRDLAGLQFVIITQLRNNGYDNDHVIIATPKQVKKFAGEGNADKEFMVNSLPLEFRDSILQRNYKKTTGLYDIADAYWIAKYVLNEYTLNTNSVETKQQ